MFPFKSKIPPQDQYSYVIDSISGAYYGLYMGFLLPFVPMVLKRLGATNLQMGLCMSIPYFAYLVSPFLLPFFNKFKALDVICILTGIFRPTVIAIGIFSGKWIILIIYLLNQVAEGMGVSIYIRLLEAAYSDEGRGLALGYQKAFQSICQLMGFFLGGILIDQGHAVMAFGFAGLSGFLSSLTFLRVLKGKYSPEFSTTIMRGSEVLKTFVDNKTFFWMNISVTFFYFGSILLVAAQPTYFVDKFDISNSSIGFLNSLSSMVAIVFFPLFGTYATRGTPQKALLMCFFVGMFEPWVNIFAPTTAFLTISFFMCGAHNAGFEVSWPLILIKTVPTEKIAFYVSVFILLLGVRGTIAGMLSNTLIPIIGVEKVLALSGLLMAAGFFIGIFSRKRWG
ncbi:MAG: MFS transporter [Candidatus Riflebacteria bacterium]|nr:MFS transporter [Candidatus Riflebacteria bacterium]